MTKAKTGIRRKICWCRRADSNRQPIAFRAIRCERMQWRTKA